MGLVGGTLGSFVMIGACTQNQKGKKVCFLLGKDFVTWDMTDSVWAGVVAIAFDVPSGAYFCITIPVRTFLGALRSEVLVPRLSASHFELVELIVISYCRAGVPLVDGPLLSTFVLFVAPSGYVFLINFVWVAFDFLKGCL
jgi:hypothetical protein